MITSNLTRTARRAAGPEPFEILLGKRSPNPIATLHSHSRSPDFVPRKTFSDWPRSAGAGAIPNLSKPSNKWKGNDNLRTNLRQLRDRGSESDKLRWPARPADKRPHSQPS